MKPQLLLVPKKPTHSFNVRHDALPYFFDRWHYHSDVELIYLIKGEGTQFIGDHISRFSNGDVLLIGSNLPHYWRCDDVYYQKIPGLLAEAKVVHFMENFWGDCFLELPENRQLCCLLKQARQGVLVLGSTKFKIQRLLDKMLLASSGERIVLLLQALHAIADSTELNFLSSHTFQSNYKEEETERIDAIYTYTMNNYKTKITLNDISKVAYISPNSFCRYFKSQTGKTYSRFLIEIRIGNACKLLIDNKLSTGKICFECGFNNFSNFNRQFKMITGKSPLEYKKSFSKR